MEAFRTMEQSLMSGYMKRVIIDELSPFLLDSPEENPLFKALGEEHARQIFREERKNLATQLLILDQIKESTKHFIHITLERIITNMKKKIIGREYEKAMAEIEETIDKEIVKNLKETEEKDQREIIDNTKEEKIREKWEEKIDNMVTEIRQRIDAKAIELRKFIKEHYTEEDKMNAMREDIRDTLEVVPENDIPT